MKFTSNLMGKRNYNSNEELLQILGGMRDPGKVFRTIPGYKQFGMEAYIIIK